MQTMDVNGTLELSPGSLPLIEAIRVDVYDLIGEKVSINQTVKVSRPSGQPTWYSVTYDILNLYGDESLFQ